MREGGTVLHTGPYKQGKMYLRCRCATCRLPKKSPRTTLPVSLWGHVKVSKQFHLFTSMKERKKRKGVFWHRSTLATFFFQKGQIIAHYISIDRIAYMHVKLC